MWNDGWVNKASTPLLMSNERLPMKIDLDLTNEPTYTGYICKAPSRYLASYRKRVTNNKPLLIGLAAKSSPDRK